MKFLPLIFSTLLLFHFDARADETAAPESENSPKTETSKSEATPKSETQSSVGSIYKLDTSLTTDFSLDANIELHKGSHLLMGFEATNSPSTPTQSTSLDTNELRLGIGGDFRDDYTYTFNYALWGAKGQISTNTFSFELKWLGDNWIFSLEPALRFITVPIQADAIIKKLEGTAAPANVILSDPSLLSSLNFIGWDPWHFKVTSAYYVYSRNLSTIFSSSFSRFFSSSALTSANNFNETTTSFEAGYGFKWMSLALEYLYAISALDYSNSSTITGKIILFLIKDFDVELDGGTTPAVDASSSNVNFGSLGLTYYW